MPVPFRKFGVEIEFIGVFPAEAARAINAAGVPCVVENYNHATRNHWKIVHDGSLEVNSNMDPEMRGELVSPPLSGEAGLEQVRTVARALAAAGGTVNKSCGLHVHVDANDLDAGQILSIVRRYSHFENGITAFMPPSRRDSRWAYSVGGDFVERLLQQVNRYGNPRNLFGGLNRYHAVNLASYARHGTVEFRQHSGSTNENKICNWITFCLYFVNKAIQNQVVPDGDNDTDTPRQVSRGGRRPNYEARRNIVNALMDRNRFPRGCNSLDLSNVSGYAIGRTGMSGQIMNEIRQFATVDMWNRQRGYISTIHNSAMAEVWLGNTQSTDPALNARMCLDRNRQQRSGRAHQYTIATPSVNDTLFDDMPVEIANYYIERSNSFR